MSKRLFARTLHGGTVASPACFLALVVSSYGYCQPPLTQQDCLRSLELGTKFLLHNQLEAGNFAYEYNWKTKTYAKEDHQVRQAGTAWSLALIHAFHPTPETDRAVRRALEFFHRHSRTTAAGSRYVTYPGGGFGQTGTVALVALAHLDFLPTLTPQEQSYQTYHRRADQYLLFLREHQREDGLWPSAYTYPRGTTFGKGSPYADGEAMLALTKAAKHHDGIQLRAAAIKAAQEGYRRYVSAPLTRTNDPQSTKAFYQWSSMTYYELATSGWPGTRDFGDHVLRLADWMIHEHKTLERTRNTGYAYEGLLHAYHLAQQYDDRRRLESLQGVIPIGLARLTSWQIGHPLANAYVQAAGADDPRALGGVQNHRHEPQLRVDVTQHQMHAMILALRHYFDSPDQQTP